MYRCRQVRTALSSKPTELQQKQVRRLLVLNHEKRLVGIVSLGDLAVEGGDEQLAGNTLEAVSEPSPPNG